MKPITNTLNRGSTKPTLQNYLFMRTISIIIIFFAKISSSSFVGVAYPEIYIGGILRSITKATGPDGDLGWLYYIKTSRLFKNKIDLSDGTALPAPISVTTPSEVIGLL